MQNLFLVLSTLNINPVHDLLSEKMGVVYIKLAQILATQNFGNLFTEKDRQMLSSVCDNCNPIGYDEMSIFLS